MSQTRSLPPSPPGNPIIGHTTAFASDPFEFVTESVKSTGDVFRMKLLGRDVYIVANPAHVKTAMLDRDAFAKLEDFEVAFGDALLAVDGEQWQRQRHAMEGFFAPTRIHEHTETMVDVTTERIDAWTTGQNIRIDERMRSVALSNLFEVVLGQSLSGTEIDTLAKDANALNGWFKPTSWVLPHWVPTPARREFHRGATRLREWARSLLNDTGDVPNEESLLATLATLRDDPDSAFDHGEVLDQVVGMIFAGHETTALAMTYALHQIGAHPHVADRFYTEIDDVLDGQPSFTDLQELEYVDRVINEALRLYPPVHAIPRVTTRQVKIGEYVLPEDAEVLLSTWSIHRDPRFYDNPREFDPERWMDNSPHNRGYEFVPFGSGPRICIGRHFARLEMKAVLTTIGQQYRLTADNAVEVTPQMTTQPKNAVTARITNRN